MTVGLHIDNEWEALTYYIEGQEIEPQKEVRVLITWPDDTVTTNILTWKQFHGSYGDMGTTVNYTRYQLGLETNIHGVKVWIDAARFKKVKLA